MTVTTSHPYARLPVELTGHATGFDKDAWREYQVYELGWFVHLLLMRSRHRTDAIKRAKDIYDAGNYLSMMGAHITAFASDVPGGVDPTRWRDQLGRTLRNLTDAANIEVPEGADPGEALVQVARAGASAAEQVIELENTIIAYASRIEELETIGSSREAELATRIEEQADTIVALETTIEETRSVTYPVDELPERVPDQGDDIARAQMPDEPFEPMGSGKFEPSDADIEESQAVEPDPVDADAELDELVGSE